MRKLLMFLNKVENGVMRAMFDNNQHLSSRVEINLSEDDTYEAMLRVSTVDAPYLFIKDKKQNISVRIQYENEECPYASVFVISGCEDTFENPIGFSETVIETPANKASVKIALTRSAKYADAKYADYLDVEKVEYVENIINDLPDAVDFWARFVTAWARG